MEIGEIGLVPRRPQSRKRRTDGHVWADGEVVMIVVVDGRDFDGLPVDDPGTNCNQKNAAGDEDVRTFQGPFRRLRRWRPGEFGHSSAAAGALLQLASLLSVHERKPNPSIGPLAVG